MSMEGRFFGQPYGRRSVTTVPSDVRGVFNSEASEAVMG
jgi:hypothetical protein